MELGLSSSVIPVSGAAGGLGLSICKLLRAQGATPLLLDRNEEGLRAAVRDVFPELEDPSRFAYVLDVSDSQAVEDCFSDMVRGHGRVTHAVANAGIVANSGVLEMSDDEWNRVMGVNVNGVMHICRAAARHMVSRGEGAIVTVASVAGLAAKPSRLAYATSKAAVVNMTRALALDLSGHGIRVNAVAPGITQTPIQRNKSEEALMARVASIPMGRLAQPDDIAKVVLFLLSDMASYVSGHTLVADGGLTAYYPG